MADKKHAAVTSATAGLAVGPDLADGLDWEYAPAPESREIVSIAPEYGLFVNGEFGPAASGRAFPTINPATEEPLAAGRRGRRGRRRPGGRGREAALRAGLGADAGRRAGQVPVPDRADPAGACP